MTDGIDPAQIPQHIAIIMDGNGRWARSRGLPRTAGHEAGVDALRRIVRACGELGVRYLTMYTFSTENWQRPQGEVNALMELLVVAVRKHLEELHARGVRIKSIGNQAELPPRCQAAIAEAARQTADNTGVTLILALNYGGRQEIVEAARACARQVLEGRLEPDEIDAGTLAAHLQTADTPDPDLLIRTGGEMRLSNFLLWQVAYTELWVTPVCWPDFDRNLLIEAIHDYQARERRFGRVATIYKGESIC